MNRVGIEGGGESVWLAWLTISVLDEMSVLTEERGDLDRATRYRLHAVQYREALQKFGWDGRWYRRAFTDVGALVGTSGAKAFRLDSITQSWAYFANGATKETEEALKSAKDELSIYEGHVPLAWPPSSRSVLDLGTISDYPPGVRENASQYNHAALWLAQALFASGDPDGGMIVVDAVNPFKRSETMEKLSIYQGEPYAIAAEIYSAPTYPGRAGWTWYTASAGVLYRTVLEYILGIKREGDKLSFTPSLPSGWHNASVVLPFGASRYDIKFEVKSDTVGQIHVTLDGVHVSNGTVELCDDGKEHEIIVSIKRVTPLGPHVR
jgi:cyclic beta-1,2-glucan synthetase